MEKIVKEISVNEADYAEKLNIFNILINQTKATNDIIYIHGDGANGKTTFLNKLIDYYGLRVERRRLDGLFMMGSITIDPDNDTDIILVEEVETDEFDLIETNNELLRCIHNKQFVTMKKLFSFGRIDIPKFSIIFVSNMEPSTYMRNNMKYMEVVEFYKYFLVY